MYLEINFHRFQAAFFDAGRYNEFSHEALESLFNYLSDLEKLSENKIELDVLGLCSEFSEIDSDDDAYDWYVGEDAYLTDLVIALTPLGVLVRGG